MRKLKTTLLRLRWCFVVVVCGFDHARVNLFLNPSPKAPLLGISDAECTHYSMDEPIKHPIGQTFRLAMRCSHAKCLRLADIVAWKEQISSVFLATLLYIEIVGKMNSCLITILIYMCICWGVSLFVEPRRTLHAFAAIIRSWSLQCFYLKYLWSILVSTSSWEWNSKAKDGGFADQHNNCSYISWDKHTL